MYNKKIATFDFATLAGKFDTALVSNPALTNWALTNALSTVHLGGSDTAAIGGDLAYQYGRYDTLGGLGITSVQDVLGSAQMGSAAQTLRTGAALQNGVVQLG